MDRTLSMKEAGELLGASPLEINEMIAMSSPDFEGDIVIVPSQRKSKPRGSIIGKITGFLRKARGRG